MLEDGTVLPIIKILGDDNEELPDWEGAVSFVAGPWFKSGQRAYIKVELDSVEIAEQSN